MLHTGSSGTGKKMFEVVRDNFAIDGLWNLLKKSLIAVSEKKLLIHVSYN